MRTVLACMLVLPACLIAPDRPTDALPPGQPIDVLQGACLSGKPDLTVGTVGRLPSGRDALFRASTTGPRVYELTSFDQPGCYALAFDVPSAQGSVVAMDISVDGGDDLIALMTEEPTGILLTEIALGASSGMLLSSSPTAITLVSGVVNSDNFPEKPRFLHRMPLTHELWFGGAPGSMIGIADEASPGEVGHAALYPVHQNTSDDEVWLDALPLTDLAVDGASAVLVGEAETCAASETTGPADLACDSALLRNDACTQNALRCPSRGTSVLASPSVIGYSASQPTSAIDLEMITPGAQAITPTLAQPPVTSGDYHYAIDAAIAVQPNGELDAIGLWWDDLISENAALAYYPMLGPVAGIPATMTIPLTGSPTDLRIGSFTSDAPQVLVFDGAEVQCLDVGAFTPCAH